MSSQKELTQEERLEAMVEEPGRTKFADEKGPAPKHVIKEGEKDRLRTRQIRLCLLDRNGKLLAEFQCPALLAAEHIKDFVGVWTIDELSGDVHVNEYNLLLDNGLKPELLLSVFRQFTFWLGKGKLDKRAYLSAGNLLKLYKFGGDIGSPAFQNVVLGHLETALNKLSHEERFEAWSEIFLWVANNERRLSEFREVYAFLLNLALAKAIFDDLCLSKYVFGCMPVIMSRDLMALANLRGAVERGFEHLTHPVAEDFMVYFNTKDGQSPFPYKESVAAELPELPELGGQSDQAGDSEEQHIPRFQPGYNSEARISFVLSRPLIPASPTPSSGSGPAQQRSSSEPDIRAPRHSVVSEGVGVVDNSDVVQEQPVGDAIVSTAVADDSDDESVDSQMSDPQEPDGFAKAEDFIAFDNSLPSHKELPGPVAAVGQVTDLTKSDDEHSVAAEKFVIDLCESDDEQVPEHPELIEDDEKESWSGPGTPPRPAVAMSIPSDSPSPRQSRSKVFKSWKSLKDRLENASLSHRNGIQAKPSMVAPKIQNRRSPKTSRHATPEASFGRVSAQGSTGGDGRNFEVNSNGATEPASVEGSQSLWFPHDALAWEDEIVAERENQSSHSGSDDDQISEAQADATFDASELEEGENVEDDEDEDGEDDGDSEAGSYHDGDSDSDSGDDEGGPGGFGGAALGGQSDDLGRFEEGGYSDYPSDGGYCGGHDPNTSWGGNGNEQDHSDNNNHNMNFSSPRVNAVDGHGTSAVNPGEKQEVVKAPKISLILKVRTPRYQPSLPEYVDADDDFPTAQKSPPIKVPASRYQASVSGSDDSDDEEIDVRNYDPSLENPKGPLESTKHVVTFDPLVKQATGANMSCPHIISAFRGMREVGYLGNNYEKFIDELEASYKECRPVKENYVWRGIKTAEKAERQRHQSPPYFPTSPTLNGPPSRYFSTSPTPAGPPAPPSSFSPVHSSTSPTLADGYLQPSAQPAAYGGHLGTTDSMNLSPDDDDSAGSPDGDGDGGQDIDSDNDDMWDAEYEVFQIAPPGNSTYRRQEQFSFGYTKEDGAEASAALAAARRTSRNRRRPSPSLSPCSRPARLSDLHADPPKKINLKFNVGPSAPKWGTKANAEPPLPPTRSKDRVRKNYLGR